MKIIALLMSCITLGYLSLVLLDTNEKQSFINQDYSFVELKIPKLSDNRLVIENQWLAQYVEKTKPANKKKVSTVKVAPPKNENVLPSLMIAGINYQLLGIFKNDNTPFVLLKASGKDVKKVNQGEEVSPGNLLQQVSANKIVVKTNDTIIEFKLFEPIKNA